MAKRRSFQSHLVVQVFPRFIQKQLEVKLMAGIDGDGNYEIVTLKLKLLSYADFHFSCIDEMGNVFYYFIQNIKFMFTDMDEVLNLLIAE